MVSTAINRYVYVTVSARSDGQVVLSSGKGLARYKFADEMEPGIVKECLLKVGIKTNIEIHLISDITTIGTGLGGSSAVTVGLLNALYAFQGKKADPEQLASESCFIEIHKLGWGIGKQDQYASAYGGFNRIDFGKDGGVYLEPVNKATLNGCLYLYNYEIAEREHSNTLLACQNSRVGENTRILGIMKEQCDTLVKYIRHGKIKKVIEVINEAWDLKRQLSPMISSPKLDELIESLKEKYNAGVKLCGAGQSGFLLVVSNSAPMNEVGLIPIRASDKGSIIIYPK